MFSRASILLKKGKALRRAGINNTRALAFLWLAKTMLPVLTAMLIGVFLAVSREKHPIEVFEIPWIFLVGAVFFSPDIWVVHRRKKRQLALERSLPDGLDLLVICAEAGLSSDAALKRVADEFADAVPELHGRTLPDVD